MMMMQDQVLMEKVHRFFEAVQRVVGNDRLGEILSLRATPVQKVDGSFVTSGDLLVQRIVKELAEAHIGPHIMVSEELELEQLPPSSAEVVVVVVDPIDGTENFTSGLCEWGVSLACYHGGSHVASMLGAPEMRRWLRSGDRMERHRSRIRGLSSSLSREQIAELAASPEYRILGCCVVNMMAVISGSFISFENPRGARSWDILAGLNLALEQGLEVWVDEVPYLGGYLDPRHRYRFRIEHPEAGRQRDPGRLI